MTRIVHFAILLASAALAAWAILALGAPGFSLLPAFAPPELRLDFAVTSSALPFLALIALVVPGVALWGLCFGGAATLLQTAAADAAGAHVDVVQAMVTTAWNLAIAAGGLIGGFALQHAGANAEPWLMLVLSLLALALVGWASSGFRPGRRAS